MKLFKNKRFILPQFITILSLFMGVGFATVNGTMLDLFGIAEAIVLEEIYISDIDNNDSNIIINNYDGTLLNSKVILDDTDIESTKSIDITLSNNTKSHQFFEEVRYQLGDITYDNDNIEVILDERLTRGYELQPKESVTFTLTFKYTEEYKNYIKDNPEELLDNELNSIVNFYFGYLIKFYQGKGNIKPDNYYLASNNTYLSEIESEIPTRVGYIFMGWYDKEDYLEGQMFYNEEENPTRLSNLILSSYEIKLYAGWCPIEYTISFYQNFINNIVAEDNIELPREYKRVEYIGSTGTQWIDTNYKLQSNIVKYELEFSQTSTSATQTLFGAESTSGTRTFTGVPYNQSANLYIGTSQNLKSINGSLNNKGLKSKYILDISNNSYSVNYNDNIVTGKYTGELYKGANIGLLHDIDGKNSKAAAKVYRFKITDDNILQRDLIPCYRVEDNKPGMYDLISNNFFVNAGDGEFSLGPDFEIVEKITNIKYDEVVTLLDDIFKKLNYVVVSWNTKRDGSGISYNPMEKVINLITINNDNINLYAIWKYDDGVRLPSDYQRLEYIESTGTQWINTNYKLQSNIVKYELEFSQTNVTSSQSLFGSESTLSGARVFTGVPYNQTASLWIGTSQNLKSINNNLNSTGLKSKYILDISNNSYSVNYNDSIVTGTYTGELYKDGNIGLLNNTGADNQKTSAKVYRFKITDNNIIQRDLIPCYRISDSEIGMYDIVNDIFYQNAGINTFIAGPEILE